MAEGFKQFVKDTFSALGQAGLATDANAAKMESQYAGDIKSFLSKAYEANGMDPKTLTDDNFRKIEAKYGIGAASPMQEDTAKRDSLQAELTKEEEKTAQAAKELTAAAEQGIAPSIDEKRLKVLKKQMEDLDASWGAQIANKTATEEGRKEVLANFDKLNKEYSSTVANYNAAVKVYNEKIKDTPKRTVAPKPFNLVGNAIDKAMGEVKNSPLARNPITNEPESSHPDIQASKTGTKYVSDAEYDWFTNVNSGGNTSDPEAYRHSPKYQSIQDRLTAERLNDQAVTRITDADSYVKSANAFINDQKIKATAKQYWQMKDKAGKDLGYTYAQASKMPMQEGEEKNKIDLAQSLLSKANDSVVAVKDAQSSNGLTNLVVGTGQGLADYVKGYTNFLTDLKNNKEVTSLLGKLDRIQQGSGESLTSGDAALLQSLQSIDKINKIVDTELPESLRLGQSLGTSLGFMGEYVLGSGLATKAAEGVMKGIAKTGVGARSAMNKAAVAIAMKAAEVGAHVPLSPTLYKDAAINVSNGMSPGKAIAEATWKTFVETGTEKFFEGKLPKGVDAASAYQRIINRTGNAALGQYGWKGFLKASRQEYVEEVAGNAMNGLKDVFEGKKTGEQAWKEFVDITNNLRTYASVAVMTGAFSALQEADRGISRAVLTQEYKKSGSAIDGNLRAGIDALISNRDLSTKQIATYAIDMAKDHAMSLTSPEEKMKTMEGAWKYVQAALAKESFEEVERSSKGVTFNVATVGDQQFDVIVGDTKLTVNELFTNEQEANDVAVAMLKQSKAPEGAFKANVTQVDGGYEVSIMPTELHAKPKNAVKDLANEITQPLTQPENATENGPLREGGQQEAGNESGVGNLPSVDQQEEKVAPETPAAVVEPLNTPTSEKGQESSGNQAEEKRLLVEGQQIVNEPTVVRDVMNRPATLTRFGETEMEPTQGTVYQDGQQVVFETHDGKVYELGNVDEISGSNLSDLGLVPEVVKVKVNTDGTFEYEGETLVPAEAHAPSSIKYGKNGAVTRVDLRTQDGSKTRSLRGQDAVEAAYTILLDRPNLDTELQDVSIAEDGNTATVSGEQVDLTGTLNQPTNEQGTVQQVAEIQANPNPQKVGRAKVREQIISSSKRLTPEQVDQQMVILDAMFETMRPDLTLDQAYDTYIGEVTSDPSKFGGKISQGDQGAIMWSNGKAVVGLFGKANASTLLHEAAGHLGRVILSQKAVNDPVFKRHYAEAAKWSGATPRMDGTFDWSVEAEEKFARSFEKYVRDGVLPENAPSGLKKAFDALADMLRKVYLALREINYNLSPEIKNVFGAMLVKNADAVASKPGAKEVPFVDTGVQNGTVSNYIAGDYFLTGGEGVILSSDYYMRALSGMFSKATAEIDAIRQKYAKQLAADGNTQIRDLNGTDLYGDIMQEVWDVLNDKYGYSQKLLDVVSTIMQRPSGLPVKMGNDISKKLDELNSEDKSVLKQPGYHGSPHKIDKFSTEKIGTGEGAQAYGWGLYFSDLESIAKDYAKRLSGSSIVYNGEAVKHGNSHVVFKEYEAIRRDIGDVIDGFATLKDITKRMDRRLEASDTVISLKEALDKVNTELFDVIHEAYKAGVPSGASSSEWTKFGFGWYAVNSQAYKDIMAQYTDDIEAEESIKLDKQRIAMMDKHQQLADRRDSLIRQRNEMMERIANLQDRFFVEGTEAEYEDIQKSIDLVNSGELTVQKNQGYVYTVELHEGKTPDQYDYLLWHKTVPNEQLAKISQQAKIEFGPDNDFTEYADDILRPSDGLIKIVNGVPSRNPRIYSSVDGRVLYDSLLKSKLPALKTDKLKSEFLLRAGIDGVKYPVQFLSKGDARNEYNYVIFDENAIEIKQIVLYQKQIHTERQLRNALSYGQFAMVTGENPDNVQQTPPVNAKLNAKAYKWLRSKDYVPTPIIGHYGGNVEHSFFVQNMKPEHVAQFLNDFKQESAATHDKFLYRNGTYHERTGHTVGKKYNDDYSTMVLQGKEVDYAVDYDFTVLKQEEGSKRLKTNDARLTQDFFSKVARGEAEEYKPTSEWKPVLDFTPKEQQFKRIYDAYEGNFDMHIATSIPTFRETQIKTGRAIVDIYKGKNAVVYDLGGSEGGWVKAITRASGGSVASINLDPNPAMEKIHNASPVKGSHFVKEAFLEGWTEDDGTVVKAHNPSIKADVVHESMMFQFVTPEREQFVEEAKRYLKPNGIFVTEEKFQLPNRSEYLENEMKKATYKDLYFTKEQQEKKSDTVLVGMAKDQALSTDYQKVLEKNFEYVSQYWDSGNFKGFVASDSKAAVDTFLKEVGSTVSQFSTPGVLKQGPASDVVSDENRAHLKRMQQNDVESRVVAGKAVSTRTPSGKGAPDDVHTSANYDLSMEVYREAPKQYLENAVKVANYPMVRNRVTAKDLSIIAKGIENVGVRGDKKALEQAMKTADVIYEHMIQVATDNILWLHDKMDPDLREVAKRWYDGANVIAQDIAKRYDITTEQAAAVIAAHSPKRDWFSNVAAAARSIDIYMTKMDAPITKAMVDSWVGVLQRSPQGKNETERQWKKRVKEEVAAAKADGTLLVGRTIRDSEELNRLAPMIRAYNDTNNSPEYTLYSPNGENLGHVRNKNGSFSGFGFANYSFIDKTVSILRDGSPENISYNLGTAHKIRNFNNNIIDPQSKAGYLTSDTHAVAASHYRNFSQLDVPVTQSFSSGQSAATGIKGTYPVYNEAYRRAAEARGLLPRQMQSIVWEAVRGLFEAKAKSDKGEAGLKAKIDAVWNDYAQNKITADEARERIDKIAGGISVPSWARSDNESVGQVGKATKSGKLPKSTNVGVGGADVTGGVTGNDAALGELPSEGVVLNQRTTPIENNTIVIDRHRKTGKATENATAEEKEAMSAIILKVGEVLSKQKKQVDRILDGIAYANTFSGITTFEDFQKKIIADLAKKNVPATLKDAVASMIQEELMAKNASGKPLIGNEQLKKSRINSLLSDVKYAKTVRSTLLSMQKAIAALNEMRQERQINGLRDMVAKIAKGLRGKKDRFSVLANDVKEFVKIDPELILNSGDPSLIHRYFRTLSMLSQNEADVIGSPSHFHDLVQDMIAITKLEDIEQMAETLNANGGKREANILTLMNAFNISSKLAEKYIDREATVPTYRSATIAELEGMTADEIADKYEFTKMANGKEVPDLDRAQEILDRIADAKDSITNSQRAIKHTSLFARQAATASTDSVEKMTIGQLERLAKVYDKFVRGIPTNYLYEFVQTQLAKEAGSFSSKMFLDALMDAPIKMAKKIMAMVQPSWYNYLNKRHLDTWGKAIALKGKTSSYQNWQDPAEVFDSNTWYKLETAIGKAQEHAKALHEKYNLALSNLYHSLKGEARKDVNYWYTFYRKQVELKGLGEVGIDKYYSESRDQYEKRAKGDDSVERLDRVWASLDKYKLTDAEGNVYLDTDAMEQDMSPELRAVHEAIKDSMDELEGLSAYIQTVVRGGSLNTIPGYFPQRYVGTSEVQDAADYLTKGFGVGTRASSTYERTKNKAIDFNAFSVFDRHINDVLRDFYLTPAIKEMKKYFNELREAIPQEGLTGEDLVMAKKAHQIINEIERVFLHPSEGKNGGDRSVLLHYVKGFNSRPETFGAKVLHNELRMYAESLISHFNKTVGETLSNIPVGIKYNEEIQVGKRMKNAPIPQGLTSDEVAKIKAMRTGISLARYVGSNAINSLGRFEDSMLDSEKNFASAFNDDYDRYDQILDFMEHNKLGDRIVKPVNNFMISTGDRLFVHPAWNGAFEMKFKELTGNYVDREAFENDPAYRIKYHEQLMAAGKAADQVRARISNPTSKVGADIMDATGRKDMFGWYFRMVNKLFYGFGSRESNTMRANLDVIMSAKAGSKEKQQARREILGLYLRNMLYQEVMAGLYILFSGSDGDRKDFWEKFTTPEYHLRQSVAPLLTLGLGGFGNVIKLPLYYGVEHLNKVLTEKFGHVYDPMNDSFVMAPKLSAKAKDVIGIFLPGIGKDFGKHYQYLAENHDYTGQDYIGVATMLAAMTRAVPAAKSFSMAANNIYNRANPKPEAYAQEGKTVGQMLNDMRTKSPQTFDQRKDDAMRRYIVAKYVTDSEMRGYAKYFADPNNNQEDRLQMLKNIESRPQDWADFKRVFRVSLSRDKGERVNPYIVTVDTSLKKTEGPDEKEIRLISEDLIDAYVNYRRAK